MRSRGFVFLFLVCSGVEAQIRINGTVQNQEKQPLPAVNVLAYQLTGLDTLLTKYALTNAQGQFKLSLPENTYLLKVKALGFADGVLKILPTDSVLSPMFRLVPQAMQLREVVVKGPPVRANTDTTTFKVKAFADGTERSVEDLLRKLPGVKVSDNGKITVHGKAVDKVMIEGEDLFSKNYQIITRSLAAGALDKVEAIDNYSENPLLKGIERSNKMVLNLGVRPDLKIKPFGNVSGDVGYKEKYNASATVLTLLGKLKGGLVGNMNNIGQDRVATSEYELTAEDDIQGFSAMQSNLLASIPLTFINVSNIEPRRVTFNKSRLLGLTATYKASKKLKIKGFSYFYNDQLRLESGNRTQYIFGGSSVQFRDSSIQTRTPTLITNQLKVEYDLDKKTNFKYTFNHRNSDINNTVFLDTQNQQLSERVPTNGQDAIQLFNHHLNGVRRIDNKNAVVADASYNFSSLSRLNDTQSQRYASNFKIDKSFQKAQQNIDQNQQEVKATLRWKNVNKFGNLGVGLGYLYKEDNTLTDFALRNDKNQLYRPATGYKNNIIYQNDIVLLDVQQTFKTGIFRFNVGGTAQFTNAILTNTIQKTANFTASKFLLQPSLGASAIVGENQRLTLLYYNQQLLPTTDQFTNNYIQSSYRSFQRNAGFFYTSKNDTWILSYNNANWSKLYAANASVSFNRNYFYNSGEFNFSELLNFSTNRPIEVSLNQVSANWQIDRLIAPLSTKIRWECNLSQSEVLNRVNGSNLLPNYFQNLDTKVYLISAFDGFFNFQASTRLNVSRVVNQNDTQAPNQTLLFVPNLTLRMKPMEGFSIKIIGEQLNWYNTNSHDMTNLLDLDILYQKAQSAWSFSIQGNNLLNTKAIFYTNVTNYSISQNNYLLQPRWATLSVSYSF